MQFVLFWWLILKTFPVAAMANSSKRMAPDPAVHVLDLEQCIGQFCKEQGSYDLFTLLAPASGRKVSWKTACDPEWLHTIAPFMAKLVLIAKNVVLSSKKLKSAMVKVQLLV